MRKLGKSLCLFCKKWLHIEHLTLTGNLLSTSLCLFLCFCDLARVLRCSIEVLCVYIYGVPLLDFTSLVSERRILQNFFPKEQEESA